MAEIARRSIGEPSRYTHKQCVTCEQLQSSKKTKQSLSFLASSSNIAISIVAQYMWSLWNSLSYASVLIAPMHVCVSAKRCGAHGTVYHCYACICPTVWAQLMWFYTHRSCVYVCLRWSSTHTAASERASVPQTYNSITLIHTLFLVKPKRKLLWVAHNTIHAYTCALN